ncbi:hypothetical protein ACYOEI_36965 [Singulisphaera rosea]
MRYAAGIVWRFSHARMTLAPLGHAELDMLYRSRRLPHVPTFSSVDGGVRPPHSSESLTKCLDSFEAILAVSLLKAQPWLNPRAAAILVTIYCWAWGSREDDGCLFREFRSLGELTLETLVSQHRVRFASLVALADKCERAIRPVDEVEFDSRADPA